MERGAHTGVGLLAGPVTLCGIVAEGLLPEEERPTLEQFMRGKPVGRAHEKFMKSLGWGGTHQSREECEESPP